MLARRQCLRLAKMSECVVSCVGAQAADEHVATLRADLLLARRVRCKLCSSCWSLLRLRLRQECAHIERGWVGCCREAENIGGCVSVGHEVLRSRQKWAVAQAATWHSGTCICIGVDSAN